MCLLREESSNVCEVLLVGRHWNGRMSEVQAVKIVEMKNKSLKQNGSKQICLRDIGCCREKWAPVTTAWHRDKWVPVTSVWHRDKWVPVTIAWHHEKWIPVTTAWHHDKWIPVTTACHRDKWIPVTTTWHHDKWIPVTTACHRDKWVPITSSITPWYVGPCHYGMTPW